MRRSPNNTVGRHRQPETTSRSSMLIRKHSANVRRWLTGQQTDKPGPLRGHAQVTLQNRLRAAAHRRRRLPMSFGPGAIVLPTMSAGATDGSYLRNAGIPTYGHSGLAGDINDIRAHGKDERILVKSFYEGEDYLYRLVKMLSGGGS